MLRSRQDGGDACCARWLCDEAGFAEQQFHGRDDRSVVNEMHIADNAFHVVDCLADRHAHTDAVCDCLNRLRKHQGSAAPRAFHGIRAGRLNADNFDRRVCRMRPAGDTGQHGAIAQRDHDSVDGRLGQEFHCYGASTLGGLLVEAVGQHDPAAFVGECFGCRLCRVKICASEAHFCAECAHPLNFQRVRIDRGKEGQRQGCITAGKGERLAPVACACANNSATTQHRRALANEE